MKLSELVEYKTQLEQLKIDQTRKQADADLGKANWVVSSATLQLKDYNQQLEQQFNQVQQSLSDYQKILDNLVRDVQNMIDVAGKPWFVESYRLYEEEMCHDTTEYILNRRPELDQDTLFMLKSRLQNYSSWKHPGLIIRPGLENFIEDLVSFDPLYLIDERHDLLVPAMNRFTKKYQQRLRPYVIKELLNQDMLEKIPNNQFGLCLIYNLFEFRPLEIIKKYLAEIYTKLKPGGVCIFTFNDCDRGKAVRLVEQHYCCYTPGSLIQELVQSLGFELVFSWNNNGPTTWLELKKPGSLESLRGGQALAKVIPKPHFVELDFLQKLVLEFNLVDSTLVYQYTADQLKEILTNNGKENLFKSVAESK